MALISKCIPVFFSPSQELAQGKREEKNPIIKMNEIVGWNHQLNEHESEQTLGDSEGQESLEHCRPWGCQESDECSD